LDGEETGCVAEDFCREWGKEDTPEKGSEDNDVEPGEACGDVEQFEGPINRACRGSAEGREVTKFK